MQECKKFIVEGDSELCQKVFASWSFFPFSPQVYYVEEIRYRPCSGLETLRGSRDTFQSHKNFWFSSGRLARSGYKLELGTFNLKLSIVSFT